MHDLQLSFRRALPWLAFTTGIFFCNFIGRTILSPLLPSIEAEMGVSHTQAGGFFFFVSLGYSLGLFFSGMVSGYLRHRRVIALSAVGMGLGLMAASQCPTPGLFSAALAATGLVGGLYIPSGIASITTLVAERDTGKALSVHEMAPNLSFILAPLAAEVLLMATDWRGALAGVGVFSLCMGLAYAAFGKGGDFTANRWRPEKVRDIASRRAFWSMAVFFSLAIATSMGPFSILPLFLVDEHGYTRAGANQLLAASRLAGPLGALLAGWLTDRLGARRMIGVYLLTAGAATGALGLAQGAALPLFVVLQTLASVLFFAAGFSMVSRLFPPEDRSVAISLMIPLGALAGMGMVPAVLGLFGDISSFGHGLLVMGLILVSALWLLRYLDRDPARHEVSRLP